MSSYLNSFRQYSETAALKEVIIGRYQEYAEHEAYVELVNENQKQGLPSRTVLEKEFQAFKATLESFDIRVHVPEYVGKFVYDQLTPRDLGVVIGQKFVICPMLKSSRKYEVAGLFGLIRNKAESEPNILIPGGVETCLEGGDIIVDHPYIFVGISQRTNRAGLNYLRNQFSNEFEIVEVNCKSLREGEDVLHLDCAFNPVGEGKALVYPQGFKELPSEIYNQYDLIEVNEKEQRALATNVLAIDQKTVLARDHEDCKEVNNKLKDTGMEVIELPFNGAPSTGGSFRCCSLPLHRQ